MSAESGAAYLATKDLTPDHKAQLARIREIIVAWSNAEKKAKRQPTGPNEEELNRQRERLAGFELPEPFKFNPPPPQKFRRVLLSMTKCYWLALVNSLSPSDRARVTSYLEQIPPFRDRPPFDGAKLVGTPLDLSMQEYEGLMRVALFVVVSINEDLAVWWRELAEVGVVNWEESDDYEESDESEDGEYEEDIVESDENPEGEWEDMKE